MRLDIWRSNTEEGHAANRLEAHCPECEANLAHESGCTVCRACGYASCG